MSTHLFGGTWTERKLSVVRRYLEVYTRALKNQPFKRRYVDAFAGTGDRASRRGKTFPLLDLAEFDLMAKGSARLALDVEPPFDRYVLIERARRHASALRTLATDYPQRAIQIVTADANVAIVELCGTTNWRDTRGVVFLDPYGLQVAWDTLVAIARTRAIDAWILFPTGMGLNRLLTKRGLIRKEWQDVLDRFLGTADWRSAFYRQEETPDLFAGSQRRNVKDAAPEKFEQFILARLQSIFPVVMDKGVPLTNSKGQTMYLLCFVSANPKAKDVAMRLARWAAEE